MRGTDQQASHMFSYVSLEQRVPAAHPLRPIRQITDRILRHALAEVHEDVLEDRPPLDSAGEIASRPAAADLVYGTQGAVADGTIGIQSSLPVVRRPQRR